MERSEAKRYLGFIRKNPIFPKISELGEIQAQIDDLWGVNWNSDYRCSFKDGCIKSNKEELCNG